MSGASVVHTTSDYDIDGMNTARGSGNIGPGPGRADGQVVAAFDNGGQQTAEDLRSSHCPGRSWPQRGPGGPVLGMRWRPASRVLSACSSVKPGNRAAPCRRPERQTGRPRSFCDE